MVASVVQQKGRLNDPSCPPGGCAVDVGAESVVDNLLCVGILFSDRESEKVK